MPKDWGCTFSKRICGNRAIDDGAHIGNLGSIYIEPELEEPPGAFHIVDRFLFPKLTRNFMQHLVGGVKQVLT
jgi:hypothetical protein